MNTQIAPFYANASCSPVRRIGDSIVDNPVATGTNYVWNYYVLGLRWNANAQKWVAKGQENFTVSQLTAATNATGTVPGTTTVNGKSYQTWVVVGVGVVAAGGLLYWLTTRKSRKGKK